MIFTVSGLGMDEVFTVGLGALCKAFLHIGFRNLKYASAYTRELR